MIKATIKWHLRVFWEWWFSWLGFLAEGIWKGLFGKIWTPYIFSIAECFTWGKNYISSLPAKEKYAVSTSTYTDN